MNEHPNSSDEMTPEDIFEDDDRMDTFSEEDAPIDEAAEAQEDDMPLFTDEEPARIEQEAEDDGSATVDVPSVSQADFAEDFLPDEEIPADRLTFEDDDDIDPLPEGEYTSVPRPERIKKRPAWLKILLGVGKSVLALALIAAILVGAMVGYLTVTEYYPAYAESASRGGVSATDKLKERSVRLLTFNTGYAGLDESVDFFMDGGQGVKPDDENAVISNMLGIEAILQSADADFILLQEVDTDSDRTFHIDQWLQYEFDLGEYESRYALNYSCQYVPYPLHDMLGEVHSGIATFSRYDISSATRYSLPCPFEWPTRAANLKRCLLVTRIPLTDSEQELVIVNLHLEAYDDGEGKLAQTEQLFALLEEEYAKGNYVIAGGDFNQSFPDTLDTYPIKDGEKWQPGILEEPADGWQYAYDDMTATCRLLDAPYSSANTQLYVIDGYIVSPNVQIDAVRTLDEDFAYSDHNPVLLDVTLLP